LPPEQSFILTASCKTFNSSFMGIFPWPECAAWGKIEEDTTQPWALAHPGKSSAAEFGGIFTAWSSGASISLCRSLTYLR
jgi:hypothetical protein